MVYSISVFAYILFLVFYTHPNDVHTFLDFLYAWRDLNPHGLPLGPKPSASAIPPQAFKDGAAGRDRTDCLPVFSGALYPLSYCGMVGGVGIEPTMGSQGGLIYSQVTSPLVDPPKNEEGVSFSGNPLFVC